MLIPTAVSLLNSLATLIIVANAPGNRTFIIGDSRTTHEAKTPYTYSDNTCKIRIINNVVVAGVGYTSHIGYDTKTGKVIYKSWDTFKIASELIQRHGSKPWTQDQLDKAASEWARIVKPWETKLENQGARRLKLAQVIFLTDSPDGQALRSSSAVTGDEDGLTVRQLPWGINANYEYFGDPDAVNAAAELAGKYFSTSFEELEAMETAGSNASRTVHAPFAEVEISARHHPKWVNRTQSCR
jgi:hypothetical protein